MITNKEINQKLKAFKTLNYKELEIFYEEMKEYHYYTGSQKNREIAQKILKNIYQRAQQFEEFKTDPHLNPEMRTANEKLKRAKKAAGNKIKHNWNIEYETEETNFSEFNGNLIVYTLENQENGKMYIGYTKTDYGVQKIFNNLSSEENSQTQSLNKDLFNDWKKYGERNFKMIVKKVCYNGEEEAKEYKKVLINNCINNCIQVYNKNF